MILRTNRLTIRPIAASDAPALFMARSDPEVMRYWDSPTQESIDAVEQVFVAHIPELREGRTLWWVVALTADGPAIGECDLSEIDRHSAGADVGFLLARAYWRQGYAREAMERVIEYAFGDLGLERLSAHFQVGNEASRRLLERLGFSYEGMLRGHTLREGAPRDCLMYARVKS
jgi:[ribosomal protein S5]-alanine N-acetyltransferase